MPVTGYFDNHLPVYLSKLRINTLDRIMAKAPICNPLMDSPPKNTPSSTATTGFT